MSDEYKVLSLLILTLMGRSLWMGKGRDDLCDLTWLCGCETCDMIDDWPLKKGCNVVGSV